MTKNFPSDCRNEHAPVVFTVRERGDLLMCPLCATSAILTAAAATTTATAIGTLSFDLSRLFIARCEALKEWFLRYLESGKRNEDT
jgi:hypothetical protein